MMPLLRPASPSDRPALDALLSDAYPRLLKPDYAPEVLRAVLPAITRARPSLLACGSYYVLEARPGVLLAAGGWTLDDPWGGIGRPDVGHIRHVVTDADALRCGHGRRIMELVLREAARAGVARLECYSTLTARGFYRAMGFAEVCEVVMTLGAGRAFEAVHMRRQIPGAPP